MKTKEEIIEIINAPSCLIDIVTCDEIIHYLSESPEVKELEPLPSEAPEWFLPNNTSASRIYWWNKLHEYYGTPPREWWMNLRIGDKFMYVGDEKEFFHLSLSCKNGNNYSLRNCTPYVEPSTREKLLATMTD